MNEIEVLTPVTKELKLKGEVIEIRPFIFDEFILVSRLIKSVKDKLGDVNFTVITKEDGTRSLDFDMFSIIADAGEEAKGLCAIATHKDSEFIGHLNLDELLALLGTVIEVNLDFFTTKVLPVMSGLLNRFLSRGAQS